MLRAGELRVANFPVPQAISGTRERKPPLLAVRNLKKPDMFRTVTRTKKMVKLTIRTKRDKRED
jgi:hypothetical protein